MGYLTGVKGEDAMVTEDAPTPAPVPTKITAATVLGWIWAVLAIGAGLMEMAAGKGAMGFFTALSGVAACPATWNVFRNAVNVEISGFLKLVLVIGALVLAGLASGPHREGETSIASTTSSDAAQATAPAAPAAAPKVLLDIQGSGTKSTEKFTTAGSDWDLQYAYNCSNFGSRGNFIVSVNGGDGGLSSNAGVNQLGASGNDVDHYHTGGTFYLEVNSECSWHIKVIG